MTEQLGALDAAVRIELMVREQHHYAVAGLGKNASEPRTLPIVDRMIAVGDIEPDQSPVLVLTGEVAPFLSEPRQRNAEIGIAAGIHFMIGIERAIHGATARRPDIEEALLHFAVASRIVHIAEMQQHDERVGIAK